MSVVIQNVCKMIRCDNILDDISLVMNDGYIYGLQGKNGSGKTMLMKMICGLIRPSSGYIEVDGQKLGHDISFPPSVGALLENPAFVSGETAFNNLAIINALSKKAITKEEIQDTLRQVGLADNDARPYRKFSLGMKQRLGIAAAIMGYPDLVVLDEPTNALDSDGIVLMRHICSRLKAHGCLVVLSCHDQEELQLLCDSIFVIKKGRVTATKKKNAEGEWTDVEEKNM